MALQIRKPPTAFSKQPTGKEFAPVKDKTYLEWIRTLPCVVSGRFPVDAAHISYAAPEYGKTGRGKSQKASDRWTIPLSPDIHRAQHDTSERSYWISIGIDPCVVALSLWGAYPNTELALLIIEAANRKAETARRTALWPAGNNRNGD